MYQIKITSKDAGQRLDKYLHRILPKAGSGFIYKMLRKKNITLNGKKSEGGEKIAAGDCVTLFFAEETLMKFMGAAVYNSLKPHNGSAGQRPSAPREGKMSAGPKSAIICINSQGADQKSTGRRNADPQSAAAEYETAYRRISGVSILYENDHILLADKPAGVLTQKAEPADLSLNEWLIGHLLASGTITADGLSVYKPSVCNRLDRNTSGIVLCAKTLQGAQLLSRLLRDRTLHKYYKLYIKGQLWEPQLIEGYLIKDEKRNKVCITSEKPQDCEASYVKTAYKPLRTEKDKTLLEVELFTGKTHQIRAHLAGIGHPLLGDYKYGDREWNEIYRAEYQVRSQLLHAYKVVFPPLEAPFEDLSGREFTAETPAIFTKVSGPLV